MIKGTGCENFPRWNVLLFKALCRHLTAKHKCLVWDEKRAHVFIYSGWHFAAPKEMDVCVYACVSVCIWGLLRRRVLSVGLSLSSGQNLSLEEDSQAAARSWRGSAIPSSVTRQHYQRCCTCVLDINYHFLLAVYIFIYAFSFRNLRYPWANEIFVERMSIPTSSPARWVKCALVQGGWKTPALLLSSSHAGCGLSPGGAGKGCATTTGSPGLPGTAPSSPGFHPLQQVFIKLRN